MDRNFHAIARMVEEESNRRRSQRRVIVILALCVALGVGGIAYTLNELARAQPRQVQVDVDKLPPARATPGQ